MDGRISISYVQSYIKANNYYPERVKDYFLYPGPAPFELDR